MSSRTPGVFDVSGGGKCYFFPVDAEGALLVGRDDIFLESTETFQLPGLAKHIQDEQYDRAFLLCHGWNNDPEAASTLGRPSNSNSYADETGPRLYSGLISGLHQARQSDPDSGQGSKDLYIGINWPSMVLAETWEDYVTRVTSSQPGPAPGEVGKPGDVNFSRLDPARQEATLHALSAGLGLTRDELEQYRHKTDALKKAVFNQREALAGDDWDTEHFESPALLASASSDRIQGADEFKKAFETAIVQADQIDHSGRSGYGFLDILRGPTGRMMKKRAGIIGSGSHPIRALLAELLASGRPVNLLGHSYGCKLLLDSVRGLFDPKLGAPRVKDMQFNSFILCQPAISRWVFSPDGSHYAGCYRPLLDEGRFNKPVVTLFSDNDTALRYMYPLGYFFSPREITSPVRRMPEKTGRDIKMDPLLGANLPAAALGCHGPVEEPKEGDRKIIHILAVQASGTPYEFSKLAEKCVGIKGNWTHHMQEQHKGEELGWGQNCVFWLWHELAK